MIEEIPVIGSQFLSNIPRLEGVASIVMWSDKHYDSGGLPVGSLHGNDIPIGSRIIKLLKEFYGYMQRGITRKQALEKSNEPKAFSIHI